MTQRWVVLNIILACLMGTLGFLGYLTKPYTGEAAPMVITISVSYLIFLVCLWKQSYQWAKFFASGTTQLGLIGTGTGLLIAFGAADFSKDAQTLMASILQGIYFAFYCTVAGLVTNYFARASLGIVGEWFHE